MTKRMAFLNHIQANLNEAHSALCDLVAEQDDWTESEAFLLQMIDSAIVTTQALREREAEIELAL